MSTSSFRAQDQMHLITPIHSAMRCSIYGTVQGVWFRASAKEQAEKLGISGWVRNEPDGTVEVFACGNPEQLELFDAWLKHGPSLAKVTQYTREDCAWQEYKGFDIL